MDNLAASPGTGPNTGPLTLLRKPRPAKAVKDLPKRTLVMGILNVTEDSFSDGGQYLSPDAAIQQGLRMFYAGADIIDVGGESTRPDSIPVDKTLEQERVLPVVRALAKAGAVVSVDTKRASTAEAAIEAGAAIINDVSGNELTDKMAAVVASTGVHYVLTHARGEVKSRDPLAEYADVVAEVTAELQQCIDRLLAAGVRREQIIVDPGLGFNKNAEDNWRLLAGLDALEALGFPVLVAGSRKRFLGELLLSGGKIRAAAERDDATLALTSLAARRGVWGVRVHDVEGSVDAVAVAEKLRSLSGQ
jgi:dihydropteroate synthase